MFSSMIERGFDFFRSALKCSLWSLSQIVWSLANEHPGAIIHTFINMITGWLTGQRAASSSSPNVSSHRGLVEAATGQDEFRLGIYMYVSVRQGVKTKCLLFLIHFCQNRVAHLLNQHAGFSWKRRRQEKG